MNRYVAGHESVFDTEADEFIFLDAHLTAEAAAGLNGDWDRNMFHWHPLAVVYERA